MAAFVARLRGIDARRPDFIGMRGRVNLTEGGRITVKERAWVQGGYRLTVDRKGCIVIGARSHLGDGARLHAMAGGRIILEDDCWLNHSVEVVSRGEVRVGRWTRIGPGVYLIDHDHQTNRELRIIDQGYKVSPIILGLDCWVGARAILLRGAGIGDGGVLAAGAVLTKSVPPGEIWAGVPARKIGERK